MSDLIKRADAIEAICNKCGGCDDNHDECWEITALKALPSAEIPTMGEKHQLSAETPTTDLISRADAIEAVRKELQEWGSYAFEDYRRGLYEAQDILEALPSAEAVSRKAKCCPIAETCMSIDCPVSSEYIGRPSAEAVQVVRCKDCRHYIVEGITTRYGWCHEYKHSVDEDDYCSYGERKK